LPCNQQIKVMENKTTLRQQLAAFKNGQIMDSDGDVDSVCSNFFDWFCKDTSLRNKAIRLFGNVTTFVKRNPQIDLDKHYVFFKNNCPFNGSLYDDFRICDIESGDVIYNVTPRCGRDGKAKVWSKENGFNEPLKEADTFRALFKA
jgi:hypothetical protein